MTEEIKTYGTGCVQLDGMYTGKELQEIIDHLAHLRERVIDSCKVVEEMSAKHVAILSPQGGVDVHTTATKFGIELSGDYAAMLLDKRVTREGQTVGELNCDRLHDKLDEWLYEALKNDNI
jgi:hypothetical protein